MSTAPTAEDLLGLFPPGTSTDGDGTLVVGGCRLDEVATEFGTPAIVVSEDALRNRAQEYLNAFRGRWPRSDLAFASKSFPCTAVQRVMVEEGLHLDVAGGGEILTAIKAGADPARLVSSWPSSTASGSWSSTTSMTSIGWNASCRKDIGSAAWFG